MNVNAHYEKHVRKISEEKLYEKQFFFTLCLTLGARLPVLGPFHTVVVPSNLMMR